MRQHFGPRRSVDAAPAYDRPHGDRRGQQDGEALRYCGATAMSFNDPGDYGVVKRFVLLSALQPGATLGNLGFRCARSTP